MRFKAWYLAGLAALLATNALQVAIPAFLENALSAADPANHAGDQLTTWSFAIFGAALGVIVVRTASRMLIFVPGREAEYLIKNDYFRHLLRLQPPFYRRHKLGDLMSRGTNDIQFIRVLIGFAGLQILNVAFALPLNLYMMLQISWELTLGCIVPLGLSLVVMRYGVLAMMSRMKAAQEELAGISDEILESYNGVRVVQSYGAEAAMTARFEDRNGRYVRLLVSITFIRSFMLPIVRVVGNLGILILLYYGGKRVANGDMHYGAVAAFSQYVANIVTNLTLLGFAINIIQRGQISLERVLEVLQSPTELPSVKASLPEGPLAIEVRDLTFTYPVSGESPSLEAVNLSVGAGDTLGIFGATGSGKSTLIRLLTRLETPPPGAVYLGGGDVRDVDLSELRQAVAIVPQSPYLFSRTLRENVAISSREAPDDEQVMAAVTRAQLANDLSALSDGLETMVGERGVTLSGGQRQRAALARAFYRDSRVLILDDTLSAVDQDTEQRLIQAIYQQAQGRTTVLISHRVSALAHADTIVVLDKGRVLQSGSHDELLARGGPYADAWDAQQEDQNE